MNRSNDVSASDKETTPAGTSIQGFKCLANDIENPTKSSNRIKNIVKYNKEHCVLCSNLNIKLVKYQYLFSRNDDLTCFMPKCLNDTFETCTKRALLFERFDKMAQLRQL